MSDRRIERNAAMPTTGSIACSPTTRASIAGDYIADDGFTARVMTALPAPCCAPAWRKPAVTALWGVAAVGLAVALPGAAVDVAREAFKLFAAKPFSLSEIAAVLAVAGLGTWTTAFYAWQR